MRSESPRVKPKVSQLSAFNGKRLRFILFATLALFAAMAVRAIKVHLFPSQQGALATIAGSQYQNQLKIAGHRGNLYDRKGDPLAISIKKPSLYVNPKVFSPTPRQLVKLSRILKIGRGQIRQIAAKDSYFSWLSRRTSEATLHKVDNLGIRGLYSVWEPFRSYPSQLAPQLIGYVGTDNTGLMGLEKTFEPQLQGQALVRRYRRDGRGRPILLDKEDTKPEQPGHNLTLTIDRAIQEVAEKALAKGVANAKAKKGFAIVSDPYTGKILAVANTPKFNPYKMSSQLSHTRNSAFNDLYEPGSVLKPLVAALAVAGGKTTMDKVFYCGDGVHREKSLLIRDDHPSKFLTVHNILVKSSNIGIYKVAKELGPEAMHDGLRAFGIGNSKLNLGLPGQEIGRMLPAQKWRKVRFANIAFGQGLTVTGLELVAAYGAIANGGLLMKPYLVEAITDSDGRTLSAKSPTVLRKVLPKATAKQIALALKDTVERGTARRAKLPHHSSGGKTGTSQKADPHQRGYSKTLRIASFIGIAPITEPHLVIYVVVDEPGKVPAYGGRWAAPVFAEIAAKSLKYLNVRSDKVTPKPVAKLALKPGTKPGKKRGSKPVKDNR